MCDPEADKSASYRHTARKRLAAHSKKAVSGAQQEGG